MGSQATLTAVSEERPARARVDYLASLGALKQAAALTVLAWTELPPERAPTRIDKLFARYPDRLLEKLVSLLMSERQRAFMTKHPMLLRLAHSYGGWKITVGWNVSPDYMETLVRRLDAFLDRSNRAVALAPTRDLDLLRRVEAFVLEAVRVPPAQNDALAMGAAPSRA